MNIEQSTQPTRPKRGLILGLALTVLLIGGFSWAMWPKGPPQIQLSLESYDFGQIQATDKVETTVMVRNVGGRPLEILKVTASCGCTKAQLGSETLQPGQQTTLKIIFDAASHSAESMDSEDKVSSTKPEEVTHAVYLRTNDPEHPEVEVEIKAQIVGKKVSP
ncbi:DUF1573 domain-containing protein [Candidatus Acetothermia bacterium]|nr:DUF1573 domain-containing protein [Candidatus Acetothermia bacterium]